MSQLLPAHDVLQARPHRCSGPQLWVSPATWLHITYSDSRNDDSVLQDRRSQTLQTTFGKSLVLWCSPRGHEMSRLQVAEIAALYPLPRSQSLLSRDATQVDELGCQAFRTSHVL